MNELSIQEKGQRNVIRTDGVARAIKSSIHIDGNQNRIESGRGWVLNGLTIQITGDRNEVIIGDDCRVTGRFIQKLTPGNRIVVGRGVSMGGVNIIDGEGTEVQIGDDCMLAFGIDLRTTDSHGIYDRDSGKRVNPGQSIIIGNHVWIAAYALLLGGSVVPSGSVVGTRSLVTGALEEPNAVYAGTPARLIRRNIRWERPLLG